MINTLGIVACIITTIGFGTNFIPVKSYDVGDGMFFQWVMCMAIWVCGLIIQLVRQSIFYELSMIGGFLWCTGNIIIFHILRTIGYGIGILVWGCTSMFIGWSVGYFGLLGVNSQSINDHTLNIVGICLILVAIILMYPVNSTVKSPSNNNINNNINYKQKMSGFGCAVVAGILFGVSINPSQYLIDSGKGESDKLIDYIFSHYCGILLSSTTYFLMYCMYKKNNPVINNKIILPGFLCGTVWSLAHIFSFVATSELSFVVAFPIVAIGPGIITNLCMVFIFKEIVGIKNYVFITLSIFIAITGIILICLSMI